MNADITAPYVLKRRNLIGFQNKKLLLLNNEGKMQSIPQQLKIDYLYLSDNFPVDTGTFKNKMLIIAGSNSDKYINSLLPTITKTHHTYYVLKRNKSLNMASNAYK